MKREKKVKEGQSKSDAKMGNEQTFGCLRSLEDPECHPPPEGTGGGGSTWHRDAVSTAALAPLGKPVQKKGRRWSF